MTSIPTSLSIWNSHILQHIKTEMKKTCKYVLEFKKQNTNTSIQSFPVFFINIPARIFSSKVQLQHESSISYANLNTISQFTRVPNPGTLESQFPLTKANFTN